MRITTATIEEQNVTYEIDNLAGLGVDCEDETLAAQVYRTLADALDAAEEPGR